MKPIDLIEELLCEYSHIVIDGKLHNRNHINFSLLNHRQLNSSVSYKAQCSNDQVSFVSRCYTRVHKEGSDPYMRPRAYVLLNVDLKNPRSIIDIRQFLEHLR